MDGYSSKGGIGGVIVPRKGRRHLSRDASDTRDRNGPTRSQLGGSSRANRPKAAQVRSSGKGKSMKHSFRSSSSSKEAIGSSSRTTSNPGKLHMEPHNSLSQTSSAQDGPEIAEPGRSTEKSSAVVMMEVGSSSRVSKLGFQRNYNRGPGLHEQEIKSTTPMRPSVSSRYGLRNLRCNSISDVIPAGCPSSESNSIHNRRNDAIKKRDCEGEGSSTLRGKKMTESSLEGRNSVSKSAISILDSRRSRNYPSHNDMNIASVRRQRSISHHARRRFSSPGNEHPVATSESTVIVPLSPPSGDLDGITEVLLAIERFEQDEELTPEQTILLETHLFLNRLNSYDHHSDMRLDIDDMSYEELLALEERMGTVSTALTEEALSECLKRSIYQFAPSNDAANCCNPDNDDIKCCICQEEFIVGDEVGSLQCKHRFHVVCIQEWLRLKNWCPICKVSAALSDSSSSPH